MRIVEAPPAHDHQPVVLNHLDRRAVVRHDSLQLGEDRLEGVLQAQRLAEGLRDGEQRLGTQSSSFQLGDAPACIVELGDELDLVSPDTSERYF